MVKQTHGNGTAQRKGHMAAQSRRLDLRIPIIEKSIDLVEFLYDTLYEFRCQRACMPRNLDFEKNDPL